MPNNSEPLLLVFERSQRAGDRQTSNFLKTEREEYLSMAGQGAGL